MTRGSCATFVGRTANAAATLLEGTMGCLTPRGTRRRIRCRNYRETTWTEYAASPAIFQRRARPIGKLFSTDLSLESSAHLAPALRAAPVVPYEMRARGHLHGRQRPGVHRRSVGDQT